MLGETAQWLTGPPSATLATCNAYLESFGIHCRTLGAFLANSGTLTADDVLAKHYSSNWPVRTLYWIGQDREQASCPP